MSAIDVSYPIPTISVGEDATMSRTMSRAYNAMKQADTSLHVELLCCYATGIESFDTVVLDASLIVLRES